MLSSNQVLFRLIIAAVLCGLVGLERERRGKSAGLKTHIIVGISSALITSISLDAFQSTDSIARIMAGILTGIGFIGAGTIMQHKDHIEGLTTAAGIWAVAIIGIVVGMGYYVYALWATTLIMITFYLTPLERSLVRK